MFKYGAHLRKEGTLLL